MNAEDQQKHKIFIIESQIPDDIITDDELIYKLKEILKKVSLSSSSLQYKAILSEQAFETLIKLKSYENSLNCKLHNCLHRVSDIDNYIINQIDKNEIRNIISKINVPISDDDNKWESSLNVNDYNRKPSSIDIKTNPYCNSFIIEPGEINEISRLRSSNNPAVLSYTTNTSSSMNSSHSIDSNNCLNVDNNYLKDRSSLFITRSISCVNERETSQTNLSPLASKTAMSLSKRQFSLFNLNYYQSRRITPLPIRSSSVFSASDELDVHAQACVRNHIRRNGISNPYHIPLKEGIRELYEKSLRISEASLQKKVIQNEYSNENDDNDYKNESNFKGFLQKILECFKPKKIENYDSSSSYQF